MKSIRPLKIALAVSLTSWAFCANAQFVGDVYFVEPSVTIPQGGTGELQVALFAGDRPFGAALTELAFDATALEVVSVQASTAGSVLADLKWEKTSTGIRILTVNGKSLKDPFGTIVLGVISVRPIAAAGTTVSITSTVKSAYDVSKSAYPSGTGFGAEINVGTVVAASASRKSGQSAPAIADGQLASRALKMRPPGHQLELYVPAGGNSFSKTAIRTQPQVQSSEEASKPIK